MSEKIQGVYRILNTINGKCYIGSSVNIKKRWYEHKRTLRKYESENVKLQNAWSKYGEPAFKFIIVEVVDGTKEDLYKKEQFYIDKFNSVRCGYNVSPAAGSNAGYKHSDEAKEKMSKIRTGRKGKACSDETKAKISKANKGRKCTDETRDKLSKANIGRKCSDETRAKLVAASAARKGVPRSEEVKLKISQANKGKIHTEKSRANMSKGQKDRKVNPETRAKTSALMSALMSGENNPNYGKKHSPETRAKMSALAKKRWADKKALKTVS